MPTLERGDSTETKIPWPLIDDEELEAMVKDNLAGMPLRKIVLQRVFSDYDLLRRDRSLSFSQKEILDGVNIVYGDLDNVFGFVNSEYYLDLKGILAAIEPDKDEKYDDRMIFLGKKFGLIEPTDEGVDEPDFKDEIKAVLMTISHIEDGQVLESDPTGFLFIGMMIVKEHSMDKTTTIRQGMLLAEKKYRELYNNLISRGALRDVQVDRRLVS